jgi:hypothetical protein
MTDNDFHDYADYIGFQRDSFVIRRVIGAISCAHLPPQVRKP